MKVLLIGGSGFIGSHLKDRLAAHGHQVRSLDRAPERFRAEPANVEHLYGEVGNESLLDQALDGVEAVFHLAWCTVPKTAEEDPTFDIQSNLALTTEVLKGTVRHRVPHLLFFSSGGTVYGPSERAPIDESHATHPICSYGVTKLAAEKYIAVFARRHTFRATILRCANPYGERQDSRGAQGAVAVFLQRAASREPIHIWGDGETVRDYVHVDDLTDGAMRAIAHSGEDSTVLNLGSGTGVSLNELVERIRRVTGVAVDVVHQPSRSVDVPWNVLDVRRAANVLGYQPRISIDAGIARTWAWMRHGEPGRGAAP